MGNPTWQALPKNYSIFIPYFSILYYIILYLSILYYIILYFLYYTILYYIFFTLDYILLGVEGLGPQSSCATLRLLEAWLSNWQPEGQHAAMLAETMPAIGAWGLGFLG